MTGKKQGIAGKNNDALKSKYDFAWKRVIKTLFKDFLEFFSSESTIKRWRGFVAGCGLRVAG